MNAATKEEAQPVNGEVVPYVPPASAVEEYRPRIVMAPEEAKALDDQLRACMQAILREGVDYGTIPGAGDRKNLLKPGAEKLLQWFGFGSRSVEVKIERDDPDSPSGIADKARRIGVTYRTEVTKTIPGYGEIVVATCEGYAGYDEDRYFQTAEEARAKAKAKEERFAKQDGRPPKSWKWESITEDYRAPWNTVVKMAQKRSYVGGAIDATSAAGLFTQDMEDAAAAGASVSPAAAVASAASEIIASLPEEARRGVDKWRRAQDWPGPGEWDASQWCAALVQAGRLDATLGGSMSRSQPHKPAEDIWTTPAGSDGSWAGEAMTLVLEAPDVDSCRMLYRQAVAKAEAGEISAEDRKRICDLASARADELQNNSPVEGAVSAPDGDPWQAEIDAMTTREDSLPLLDKVNAEHKGGVLDSRRAQALRVAIRAKADGLPSAPGEAA
jgi:hypothetical protein